MLFTQIRGIHINGRKEMSTKNEIVSYLNPKCVYFPTTIGNVAYTPIVEIGDDVLKGQPILERSGRFGHPVCSSVSGKVTAKKKMWHSSGKMIEMLEITNDGEERTIENWNLKLDNLTKENIIERMKNSGIVGLGGAGFPTYVKYLPLKPADVLIINAAECEPYITADYMLIINQTEKLLRGIEYMMIASGSKKAVVAIKKTKKPAIKALEDKIKNHPNIEIKLLNDVYPAGWERYIVEHVTGKTYSGLPSDVGAVVNNVQTAIAVCEAVEENKPLIEKIVTFTGEGLVKPCNVLVKIGTKVSEVITEIGGYVENLDNAYFIAGGPMTGKSIMFDDLIITNSLGSVIVKPNIDRKNNPSCMGCGKCAEACPAFLTPTEIKSAYDNGDIDGLNKLNVNKCVQCGLCSYVCPSRVDITEIVGKAKEAAIKANALKSQNAGK